MDIELDNVTESQYNQIKTFFEEKLRTQPKKRDAVADAFSYAVQMCPSANPSDLWHHIIYRIFINYPTNKDPGQSWKRVGGEALEIFFERYYTPLLRPHRIRIKALIGRREKKTALQRLGCEGVVGEGKLDIILEGEKNGFYHIFGGAHVKASLAERVSDDEPTSRAMMERGFFSPLLTLNVKSFPAPEGDYVNRGELGTVENPTEKRKYVENHGSFDNCYTYNLRDVPSKETTASGKHIYVQNFNNQSDAFVRDVVSHWRMFSEKI